MRTGVQGARGAAGPRQVPSGADCTTRGRRGLSKGPAGQDPNCPGRRGAGRSDNLPGRLPAARRSKYGCVEQRPSMSPRTSPRPARNRPSRPGWSRSTRSCATSPTSGGFLRTPAMPIAGTWRRRRTTSRRRGSPAGRRSPGWRSRGSRPGATGAGSPGARSSGACRRFARCSTTWSAKGGATTTPRARCAPRRSPAAFRRRSTRTRPRSSSTSRPRKGTRRCATTRCSSSSTPPAFASARCRGFPSATSTSRRAW